MRVSFRRTDYWYFRYVRIVRWVDSGGSSGAGFLQGFGAFMVEVRWTRAEVLPAQWAAAIGLGFLLTLIARGWGLI